MCGILFMITFALLNVCLFMEKKQESTGNEFFQWDKACETGIAKIDVQHRVIVKILNDLYDIVIGDKEEEKMKDIIHELVQYTIYHFGEEEKLFKKYGFPLEKEHKEEHQKFINKVKESVRLVEEDKGMVALELITFLKDWLTEHIMITDGKYAEYFKQKNIIVE